jgi:hypothetical protein
MKTKFLLPAAVLVLGSLYGCAGGGYYSSYRVGPPPPPRYGAYGYAPGPGYVWTDGYWDLRGSRWSWVDGRWARPPRARARWDAPRWEQHGRGYRFHRGGWR